MANFNVFPRFNARLRQKQPRTPYVEQPQITDVEQMGSANKPPILAPAEQVELTPWQKYQQERLANKAGRLQRRSDALQRWGFEKAAEQAANRATNLQQRSDAWGAGEPPWKNKAKDTASDLEALLKYLRDTGKYEPYPQDIEDWRKGMTDVNPALEYESPLDGVFSDIGKGSVAGDYYSGYESDALKRLQEMSGKGAILGLGEDVVKLQKMFQQPQSELDKAISEQMLAAVRGELTAPNSQWYQAQSTLLDRAAQDEAAQMRQRFGAGRGVGSGRQALAQRDLAQRMAEQKQGILSSLQQEQAKQALGYNQAMQALQNDILGKAIDVAKTGNASQQQANATILDYVNKTARTQVDQANTRLQDAINKLSAQYKQKELELQKAGQLGELAKFREQYDLEQRKLFTDTLTRLFDSLTGMFGGGIGIGSNRGGLWTAIGTMLGK